MYILKTTEMVRINFKDYLDTLMKNKHSKRIQKFCRKYNLSQTEYEWIHLMIENNRFQVV